jgi:hypothetical protein
MYGMNVAKGMISAVTDKGVATAPLDSLYPIVWLDAIH